MRFSWDSEYGLGYVYLDEDAHVAYTEELGYGIVADFDAEGKLIGVEIGV